MKFSVFQATPLYYYGGAEILELEMVLEDPLGRIYKVVKIKNVDKEEEVWLEESGADGKLKDLEHDFLRTCTFVKDPTKIHAFKYQ